MSGVIRWKQLRPEERDRLVAEKIMGYSVREVGYEVAHNGFWEPGPRYSLFDKQGELAKGYKTGKYSRPEYAWQDCPCFTRSMDAAWAVVNHTFQYAPLPNNIEFIRWLEKLHLWGLSKEYVLEHIYVLALRAFDVAVDFS